MEIIGRILVDNFDLIDFIFVFFFDISIHNLCEIQKLLKIVLINVPAEWKGNSHRVIFVVD